MGIIFASFSSDGKLELNNELMKFFQNKVRDNIYGFFDYFQCMTFLTSSLFSNFCISLIVFLFIRKGKRQGRRKKFQIKGHKMRNGGTFSKQIFKIEFTFLTNYLEAVMKRCPGN